MAAENGKITQVDSPKTGLVARVSKPGSPIISYTDNQTGKDLMKDDDVTMNIDDSGPELVATILTVVTTPVDPDFPATNEGDLYVPATGDLDIDGRTVTVRGTTVNGNVNLSNGGKLILTSTAEDGAQRARVTGSIFALANSTCKLIIYKSDVNGSIRFSNNNEVKSKGGSVGGDVDIRNSAKATKNNGSVGGDVDIRNMTNGVSVDGLTLTGTGKNLDIRNNRVSTVLKNIVVNHGDATVRNNQGCSYSNITAPGGTVDISGCVLIP